MDLQTSANSLSFKTESKILRLVSSTFKGDIILILSYPDIVRDSGSGWSVPVSVLVTACKLVFITAATGAGARDRLCHIVIPSPANVGIIHQQRRQADTCADTKKNGKITDFILYILTSTYICTFSTMYNVHLLVTDMKQVIQRKMCDINLMFSSKIVLL